jgi:quinolinate synthase
MVVFIAGDRRVPLEVADIALDTMLVSSNSHKAADALTHGVPVITLPGDCPARYAYRSSFQSLVECIKGACPAISQFVPYFLLSSWRSWASKLSLKPEP